MITKRGKPPRLRNCKNDYHSGQGPILEIVKTITHQGKQQNHIRISMFMLMRIFLWYQFGNVGNDVRPLRGRGYYAVDYFSIKVRPRWGRISNEKFIFSSFVMMEMMCDPAEVGFRMNDDWMIRLNQP